MRGGGGEKVGGSERAGEKREREREREGEGVGVGERGEGERERGGEVRGGGGERERERERELERWCVVTHRTRQGFCPEHLRMFRVVPLKQASLLTFRVFGY